MEQGDLEFNPVNFVCKFGDEKSDRQIYASVADCWMKVSLPQAVNWKKCFRPIQTFLRSS